MAASFAVENAAGYKSDGQSFASPNDDGIPQKAVLIRNIVLASEYLMSHITHFYALAALDYVMGPPMSPWVPYFGGGAGASAVAAHTSGWDVAGVVIQYPSGYQDGFNYYAGYLKPGAIGAKYDTLSLNAGASSGLYLAATTGHGNLSGVLTELNSQETVWSKVIADYVVALHMRRRILEVGAQFAGGLPMFRSLVMGGVAVDATSATIQNWIKQFRKVLYSGTNDDLSTYSVTSPASGTVMNFIANNYLPLVNIVSYLYPQYDNTNNIGLGASGLGIGSGYGNFLGYGVFQSHLTGAYSLTTESSMVSIGVNPYATSATLSDFTVNVNDSNAKRFHNRGYVYGATNSSSGSLFSPSGLSANSPSASSILDCHKRIVEVADYSWYYYWTSAGTTETSAYRHPWHGETDPTPTSAAKGLGEYSWAKGPRIWHNYPNSASPDLKPMQVGPLARMWVTGLYRTGMYFKLPMAHATLSTNLGSLSGDRSVIAGISSMDRHRARALECYLIGVATAQWLEALSGNPSILQEDSYNDNISLPSNASGFGIHEAPRGALGHWVVADGAKRIQNWQAVVPSTWIDSPKDYKGQYGPLEQSILSTPNGTLSFEYSLDFNKSSKFLPVEVIRIIHSYDPCLACTVHVVEKDGEKGVRK